MNKLDKIYKEKLSDFEYKVCREKGTEPPFSGKYNNFKKKGVYSCKCCDTPLFSWDQKFDSGSGWPSFYESLNDECNKYTQDNSFGMVRTEITCKECGSHLGHVFDDVPTKRRYCVNSVSLDFKSE